MTRQGALFLAVVSLFSPLIAAQVNRPSKSVQMVFIGLGGGSGTQTAIDTNNGLLRIREPTDIGDQSEAYMIDGSKFYVDRGLAESRYKRYSAMPQIRIHSNTLYYKGSAVKFSGAVRARDIYQAVLWRGWVICLGRTSVTDVEASAKPPFIETELITFDAVKRVARVKWISPFAPTDIRIYILDASP